ncbi:MAG: C25 family cysteine peptidase [Bacteroidota bacterium]
MKKLNLLLFVIAILINQGIYSQDNWIPFYGSDPAYPILNVEKQDMSGLTIDITIPGMFSEDIIHDGITYQKLSFEAWQSLYEVGLPELPIISEIIGLPDDKLVKVKILEQESITLENILVYPSQTPSKDILNGQYTGFDIDEAFYAQDQVYPDVMANTNRPGIWRDVKVSGLHICPFEYTAASRQLKAITHMKIRVDFYGTDTEVVLNRDKNISDYFYKMYNSKIINFESMGYSVENTRDDSDIKYLIITNTNPLSTLEPFIEWKNRQGFPVEVKTMETGFNTPQEFKDYITSLYNSDNLEYVLMVGDAYPNGGNNGGPDEVPMFWWAPGGGDPSYSDTWYVCVDGPDDHYADLAIGRYTYDDLSELELQLDKTLSHYQSPDASTNWAENTLLVAHKENYPAKYTQCKNEIENFSYALQTPIFTECYGGAGATNQTIIDYVNNNSCGIFNYRGHGSATEFWDWGASGSFTNTHIQQLTNDDQLFVLFDVCCDNMDIVAYPSDCLCESFMKSPVAAVAINGAIIPSYTIPNHDYDKEMYKAVFNEGIYNIGYVTNYANVTVLNVHGSIGRSNVRTYLWLGDASLEPWTLQPTEMLVDHLPTLFLGLSEFTVNVSYDGNPVANARVCISNDDMSLYAIAFTDATGEAIVNFGGSVQTPGTAHIVVSAHNHLPYITEIPIIPQEGSYFILDDVAIDDQTGNNNGFADFMEFISLDVTLENIGLDEGQNVNATISSGDQYITIVDEEGIWGNIPGNTLVTLDSAFSIQVADWVPDEHIAVIDMEINDDSKEQWLTSFELVLSAPIINIIEYVIDDNASGNGNGRIDPGETLTIKVKNNNIGHCPAENSVGYLESTSPYLTFLNDYDSLGTLGLLGFQWAEFEIEVDPDAPEGVFYADFEYELSSVPFSELLSFSEKIGIIVEDWETNGFEKFEWQMGGEEDWNTNMYNPFEGSYHAQSGNIVDNESSQLYITTEVMFADTIYFYVKTSSEVSDKLVFYIDNNLMDEWSGIGNGYLPAQYFVEEGIHTFKWIYDKNSSLSSGDDCAWVDFIEFPPLMTLTAFAGFDAESCVGEDFQCDAQATAYVSLAWTTSGTGTFDDPTIEDPIYTPSTDDFNNGWVMLSLEAIGEENDTVDDDMNLSFRTEPGTADLPQGPDFVNTYYITSSEYTTEPVQYADYYDWSVDPIEAGSFAGMGTTGTISWNNSFLGTATIFVRAMNTCGDGALSEGFEVMVDNFTSVAELDDDQQLAIFPNPNSGEFNIELKGEELGIINIRIYDITGTLIYTETGSMVNNGFSSRINLGEYQQGMYFVKVNHDKGTAVRKILLSR